MRNRFAPPNKVPHAHYMYTTQPVRDDKPWDNALWRGSSQNGRRGRPSRQAHGYGRAQSYVRAKSAPCKHITTKHRSTHAHLMCHCCSQRSRRPPSPDWRHDRFEEHAEEVKAMPTPSWSLRALDNEPLSEDEADSWKIKAGGVYIAPKKASS